MTRNYSTFIETNYWRFKSFNNISSEQWP